MISSVFLKVASVTQLMNLMYLVGLVAAVSARDRHSAVTTTLRANRLYAVFVQLTALVVFLLTRVAVGIHSNALGAVAMVVLTVRKHAIVLGGWIARKYTPLVLLRLQFYHC